MKPAPGRGLFGGKVAGSEGRLARRSARRVETALRGWSVRRSLALAYAILLAAVGLIVLRSSPIGSVLGDFNSQAQSPPTTSTAAGAHPPSSPGAETATATS